MIKEGKFGPAEAIILLVIANTARIFLPYPRMLVEIGGPAAWMTPLGGLAIALAGVFVFSRVLDKSPDKTIIEITEEAFGPVAGTLLNLVTILFFLAVGSLFTREFSEAMIIAALPSTPVKVITAMYLIMGLVGAYLGIESLARTARLMYPYALGGIVILLLALVPQWNMHNLFPLLGNGPARVFGGGSVSTAAVTEIIAAAVLVQATGGSKNFKIIGYRSMLMAFGLLILLLLTLTLTIHREALVENTLPFYRVTSMIYLGRFFQRVESIFVIIWSVIGAIKISLTFYVAAVSLARTLKLPDYRPLIWPLGLSVYISSLLPPDLPTTVNLDGGFLRSFALAPNYLLPIFILLALWLKRRRQHAGS